ncbi:glycosyltransferase family 4 protein [Luteolibacter yonseiensis]|uniref:Glycosyltransferase family 4 protein n=1 Tax=Luteolibacter yonseiensis TaxID=1144680 RepID=A0A934QYA3_9BACT|nr:glycosyltransferase family 4 protein [Luteolibacter yonseiensis]MBK1814908.1 glycosyltransferase family 4 protein [Luteolibacter yonseiensis]
MKVIQILPELNSGGVERGTLEIASYLVREGHEAVVVSNGGRLVEELERSGARHVAMPIHRKSLATLLQVGHLRSLLTREAPDVIHIRSRVPGWVTWLAWRSMDPATRPRLVSTVHGFYSVNPYSSIMAKGERVIAVSRCIREYILENYPKTDAGKIRVIPRGIEPEKYFPEYSAPAGWLAEWRAAHPGLAGKCVLLLPGRITRLKGHDDFFRLVAALKEAGVPVHGLVAGDTHAKKHAYMDELRATVERLGIGSELTFLGHRGDIREVMTVSDIVFALSQQPESFGRTVLEALALGKRVVGYDCGGVGELLGELFPPGRVALGDTASLLEVTRRVIAARPAPAAVGEPFTLEAMCRSTLDVYCELGR